MSARLRGIARGDGSGRRSRAVPQRGRSGRVSIERAVTAALSGTRLYGPDPLCRGSAARWCAFSGDDIPGRPHTPGRRDSRRAGGLDRGRLRSCDELSAAGTRVASGLRKRARARVSAVSTSAWAGVAPLPLVRTGSWPRPTEQAAIGEHVSSPEIWSDRSSRVPGQGATKYAWVVPPCDAPVKKIIRETGIRCAAF